MEFREQLLQYTRETEETVYSFLPEETGHQKTIFEAMNYSVKAGGKRLRPLLMREVYRLFGGEGKEIEPFMAAIEMIHTSSLIHDDLPCMDNDDFRRGKPSCHKAFGEATALLAGDTLLTEAFEVISGADAPAEIRARAALALAHGAGSRGMVLGQELDLHYENLEIGEDTLRLIHRNKTGALINAAVQMGVAAADGNDEDEKILEKYAFDLGLVFQIVDDVLDMQATSEELGKPIGSDAENGKTTFYTLYGAEGAMQLAENINNAMCKHLQDVYGEKAEFLVTLAQKLLLRRS